MWQRKTHLVWLSVMERTTKPNGVTGDETPANIVLIMFEWETKGKQLETISQRQWKRNMNSNSKKGNNNIEEYT